MNSDCFGSTLGGLCVNIAATVSSPVNWHDSASNMKEIRRMRFSLFGQIHEAFERLKPNFLLIMKSFQVIKAHYARGGIKNIRPDAIKT